LKKWKFSRSWSLIKLKIEEVEVLKKSKIEEVEQLKKSKIEEVKDWRSQRLKFWDSTRVCDSNWVSGATDMGMPFGYPRISIPGPAHYGGVPEEGLEDWLGDEEGRF
jgi:hypothetical protein